MCYHGNGGFNYTEIYNMPVWLRNFIYEQLWKMNKSLYRKNVVNEICRGLKDKQEKEWEKKKTELSGEFSKDCVNRIEKGRKIFV